MKIYNNNELLTDNCIVANSFINKLFGKIFAAEPILFLSCNSIHTFFLNKNLDIVFLDKDNKILKIFLNFPPNKIIFPVKNSVSVIEFNAGFLKSDKIKVSDKLVFEQ